MNDPNEMLEQFMEAQQQMLQAQQQAAQAQVTGSAGGGMVQVVITGELEVRSVHIQPEVVDPDEIEMLQDLVHAAFNDALAKADKVRAEAMQSGMPDLGSLLGQIGGEGGLDSLGGDLGGLLPGAPSDEPER